MLAAQFQNLVYYDRKHKNKGKQINLTSSTFQFVHLIGQIKLKLISATVVQFYFFFFLKKLPIALVFPFTWKSPSSGRGEY